MIAHWLLAEETLLSAAPSTLTRLGSVSAPSDSSLVLSWPASSVSAVLPHASVWHTSTQSRMQPVGNFITASGAKLYYRLFMALIHGFAGKLVSTPSVSRWSFPRRGQRSTRPTRCNRREWCSTGRARARFTVRGVTQTQSAQLVAK